MRITRLALATSGIALIGTTVVEAAPISPPIVNPATGNSYVLLGQSHWSNAEVNAVLLGGHLVTIKDAAEQQWVYQTFGRYEGQARLLWIGLHDMGAEGQFRWTSGQTPAYSNWAPGEPNNAHSSGGEDYISMYYPGHSAQGRWNEWLERTADPIGIPMAGVVEIEPGASPPPFFLQTDKTWRVIAPAGNQQGSMIGSVGGAWEAAHPGWKTSLTFDTSTWENARLVAHESVWGADADTPLYLRKVFNIPDEPVSVTLLGLVDDDAQVYINGTLVRNDVDGVVTSLGPVDVTDLLVPGENLIAVKAHDSFGAGENVRIVLYGVVPEPGALALAAGCAGMLLVRRRR